MHAYRLTFQQHYTYMPQQSRHTHTNTDSHTTQTHELTQIAVRKETADVWEFIDAEGARRAQLRLDEDLRAAIEQVR